MQERMASEESSSMAMVNCPTQPGPLKPFLDHRAGAGAPLAHEERNTHKMSSGMLPSEAHSWHFGTTRMWWRGPAFYARAASYPSTPPGSGRRCGDIDPFSSVRGDGALPRVIPHRGRTARNRWADSGNERQRRQSWNPAYDPRSEDQRLEI